MAPEAFPSGKPQSTGIALGWFGEDGQWGVAYGHIDREAFARAVDEHEGVDEADGIDPDAAFHAYAVLEEDESLPEDHDLRTCIRWNGITQDTENSFPVTAINTEA